MAHPIAHPGIRELENGLLHVLRSPVDDGRVELIVTRPAVDERTVVAAAMLDLVEGLVGDSWRLRGSSRTADGSAHPDKQLTLMNARVAALVAGSPERWALAGDQLFVDLDLSEDNLPAGTLLAVGAAVIEITEPPHLGCQKFSARFGSDSLRFVNTPRGRALRLRGVHARVAVPGVARRGDTVGKRPH